LILPHSENPDERLLNEGTRHAPGVILPIATAKPSR
jgi:hypothetical protein